MRKPGSPCTPSYSECLFYATCDATTRTCVEEPVVGQACDPNVAICIGGGAQCDPTSMTCTLMPTAGACSCAAHPRETARDCIRRVDNNASARRADKLGPWIPL